jgi:hypothetical protein
MDKKTRIVENIEKISKLLEEIKEDLVSISETSIQKALRKRSGTEGIPSDDDMKKLHDRFYEDFLLGKQEQIIKGIDQKSKKFLAAFCKANNLPIDGAKASKKKIAEELLNWLSQRKAITSEVR